MKLICKFTIDIELIVEILILEKISFLIIYWQFYHFFITFLSLFCHFLPFFVKFFIYVNILSSIDFHNNNDATVLNGDHFEIISFKVVSFKSVIL